MIASPCDNPPLTLSDGPDPKRSGRINDALAASGVEIRTVLEIESREAVAEAVAAGIGVGVALDEDAHPDNRVRPIRVRDAELYLELHLACLEERRDSPLIKAFLDVVTWTEATTDSTK